MSDHLNGTSPDANVPLDLNPGQRKAALVRIGLGAGWLLLTMAEMLSMRRNMTDCANALNKCEKENANLKAENKKLRGQLVAKVTESVKEAGKVEDAKPTETPKA